jgi:mannose-6-phosphate isomerase-like protein (cupin superfamily)
MESQHPVQHLANRAVFDPAKPTKIDCFRSARLLVGLTCLEAGQAQSVHAHAGADKFYFVVSGNARFVVGDTTSDAAAGDLVVAPADVPHGVERAFERTVLLVGIAPAPRG